MTELDLKHNEVYYSHKQNQIVVVQVEYSYFRFPGQSMFTVYLVHEDDDVQETDKYLKDMVLVGVL